MKPGTMVNVKNGFSERSSKASVNEASRSEGRNQAKDSDLGREAAVEECYRLREREDEVSRCFCLHTTEIGIDSLPEGNGGGGGGGIIPPPPGKGGGGGTPFNEGGSGGGGGGGIAPPAISDPGSGGGGGGPGGAGPALDECCCDGDCPKISAYCALIFAAVS